MPQKLGIVLTASKGFDTGLIVGRLVMDVYSDDPAIWEVALPHSQGRPAAGRIIVSANSNLQDVQLLAPKRCKVSLIVSGIMVDTFFICSPEFGQFIQVTLIPPPIVV